MNKAKTRVIRNKLFNQISACVINQQFMELNATINDISINRLKNILFQHADFDTSLLDHSMYINKMDIYFTFLSKLQESPDMTSTDNAICLCSYVRKLWIHSESYQVKYIRYFLANYNINFTAIVHNGETAISNIFYDLLGMINNDNAVESKKNLIIDEAKTMMQIVINNTYEDELMMFGSEDTLEYMIKNLNEEYIHKHLSRFYCIDEFLIEENRISFITKLLPYFYDDCVIKVTNNINLKFSDPINEFIKLYVLNDLNFKSHGMEFTHDQLVLLHKNSNLKQIIYLHVFIKNNSMLPRDITMIIAYDILLLRLNDF